MGKLTINNSELELHRRMFAEKCEMIGVDGLYYEVKDLGIDDLSNYGPQWYDPIPISFIFDELPTPKTLRNLKWWDDSDSTTPPIAYLPWTPDKNRNWELKPQIGARLSILDPISQSERQYEVTEINMNSYYMIYSIVKLTPTREDMKINGTINPVTEMQTPQEESGNGAVTFFSGKVIEDRIS